MKDSSTHSIRKQFIMTDMTSWMWSNISRRFFCLPWQNIGTDWWNTIWERSISRLKNHYWQVCTSWFWLPTMNRQIQQMMDQKHHELCSQECNFLNTWLDKGCWSSGLIRKELQGLLDWRNVCCTGDCNPKVNNLLCAHANQTAS